MRGLVLTVLMTVSPVGGMSIGDTGIVTVRCVKSTGCADPATDRSGAWWTLRTILTKELYARGVGEIAARTGRARGDVLGATVGGQEEDWTNGVYTLALEIEWSPARAAEVERLKNEKAGTKLPDTIREILADGSDAAPLRLGPRRLEDGTGGVWYVGFSAMAMGTNPVRCAAQKRLAQLDARRMAVLPFFPGAVTNAPVAFEEVYHRTVRHPICTNRLMCVYGCLLRAADKVW